MLLVYIARPLFHRTSAVKSTLVCPAPQLAKEGFSTTDATDDVKFKDTNRQCSAPMFYLQLPERVWMQRLDALGLCFQILSSDFTPEISSIIVYDRWNGDTKLVYASVDFVMDEG